MNTFDVKPQHDTPQDNSLDRKPNKMKFDSVEGSVEGALSGLDDAVKLLKEVVKERRKRKIDEIDDDVVKIVKFMIVFHDESNDPEDRALSKITFEAPEHLLVLFYQGLKPQHKIEKNDDGSFSFPGLTEIPWSSSDTYPWWLSPQHRAFLEWIASVAYSSSMRKKGPSCQNFMRDAMHDDLNPLTSDDESSDDDDDELQRADRKAAYENARRQEEEERRQDENLWNKWTNLAKDFRVAKNNNGPFACSLHLNPYLNSHPDS